MDEQRFNVKISIVTVCFNSVKTIEQTIKSVINQSYKYIEYIIIDGGSTDGTLDIIRKYESYISYWVSEPDKGIYDAMNKGINVASGELIAFINSDDWYDENAITHFAEAYTNQSADVLYGDIVYIDEYGKERYESNAKLNFDKMLYTNILCHQAICVRTELMKNNLFDLRYKLLADYDFLLSLLVAGYSFYYIGNYLIAYFRWGGVSTVRILETVNETYEISSKRFLSKEDLHYDENKILRIRKIAERRICYGKMQQIYNDFMEGKCQFEDYGDILNTKFVIFGVGTVGKQVLELINYLGAKVECFLDSNSDYWEEQISGIRVLNPQETYIIKSCKVIITSYEYNDEMAKVLSGRGLKENEDYYSFEKWIQWLVEHIKHNS